MMSSVLLEIEFDPPKVVPMACSSGEGTSEYKGSLLVSCPNTLSPEVAREGHGSTLGLCIMCEMTLTFLYLFLDLCVGGVW